MTVQSSSSAFRNTIPTIDQQTREMTSGTRKKRSKTGVSLQPDNHRDHESQQAFYLPFDVRLFEGLAWATISKAEYLVSSKE